MLFNFLIFFSKFLIGGLGDQFGNLWLIDAINSGRFSVFLKYYGQGINYTNEYEVIFSSLDKGYIILLFFFSRFLNSIQVYNLLTFIFISLNFYIFYSFFSKFFTYKKLSFILSLIMISSSYFTSHFTHHSLFFVFPLFCSVIYLVFNFKTNLKSSLIFAFLIFFTAIFSSYYGFFLLIFISLYFLIKEILKIILIKNSFDWHKMFYVFFSISVFALLYIAVNYDYFLVNIIDTKDVVSNANVVQVKRPLEDFFVFTSRPWYYILPSVNNPFFGDFTHISIKFLQEKWGHFLTENFFPPEHSTSYLGWVNMLLAVYGFILILKKSLVARVNKIWIKEMDVLVLGIVAIALIILTMPPYFTISNFKIYLPSYLVWQYFPMFRVLTRLIVIILPIMLIFTGYGYMNLYKNLKSFITKRINYLNLSRFVSSFVIFSLFIFSLLEFFVPIEVKDLSHVPKIFEYIKVNTSENTTIAVYPMNMRDQTLFWMKDYNRRLINPSFYNYQLENYEMNSEKFTNLLNSCEGIQLAKMLKVDYIIYFYSVDENTNKNTMFFDNNFSLTRVGVFDENNLIKNNFYNNKLVNVLNDISSYSSVLYKVNYLIEIDCK